MIRRILPTQDNSNTVFVEELNETYHSQNGALTESQYIFIDKGFKEATKDKNSLHIFEVGFGTGLNAILTLIEADKLNIYCTYHTIEAFPLEHEIINALNYKKLIDVNYHDLFDLIHSSEWDSEIKINGNFLINKIHSLLENFSPETKYDLVYFDAFAPDKQPELWEEKIFKKLYESMNEKGILVTYSAKGDVRRLMTKIGFAVEKLEGPPMKRHMTRARKL